MLCEKQELFELDLRLKLKNENIVLIKKCQRNNFLIKNRFTSKENVVNCLSYLSIVAIRKGGGCNTITS